MSELFNIKIVPFRIADIEPFIGVIDAVCADTPWMQTRRFEPTLAWRHALENEDCRCHLLALAKVDQQVVGWCRLFPVDASPSKVVDLGIGVIKHYRRQGIGSAMIRYAIHWTKARPAFEIILTTHRENLPAMRLFETVGFLERQREGKLLRMGLARDVINLQDGYEYVA